MRAAAGFSMIEALVTLLVLSIGLLGLGRLQAGLWRSGGDLHAAQTAFLVAQNRLESERLNSRLQWPARSAPADDPAYRVDVAHTPLPAPSSALTATRVSLHWRRPAGEQSLELTAVRDRGSHPEDSRWLLPSP